MSMRDSGGCIVLKDGESIYEVDLDEGVATLKGGDPNISGEYEIPRILDGCLVTGIDYVALLSCDHLTNISVPDSVTRIANEAFDNCRVLADIRVDEGNPFYRSSSGVLFDKKMTRLIRCPEGFAGVLQIPASVTRLVSGWCKACSRLTAVEVDGANRCFSSSGGVLYNKKLTVLVMCPLGKTGRVMIPASVERAVGRAFSELRLQKNG